MKQVWALLQPHGIIDLTSTVHYLSGKDLWDVSVRAEPRRESWLEPVQFPYRLENVQGIFTYGRGGVTFEHFSAWHGPVKLACNGSCGFRPDGGWQLQLDRLAVDLFRLDRQFMQLLPPQLKKNLGELNFTGRISMHGNVIVARSGNPAEPTSLQWKDVSLGLNQAGLDCGARLENIYGTVRVNGWSEGTRFQMRGEMDIESMTCHDIFCTQVTGPFWIDEQKALFGSWVAAQDNSAGKRPKIGAAAARRSGSFRRQSLRRHLGQPGEQPPLDSSPTRRCRLGRLRPRLQEGTQTCRTNRRNGAIGRRRPQPHHPPRRRHFATPQREYL